MTIQYGHILGRCIHCGATDFDLATAAEQPKRGPLLRCKQCSASTWQSDLVCQIGDEAVRQAESALASLASHYEAHRKRVARLRAARAW